MSIGGSAQRALRLKAELQRLRALLAEQPTVQQVIVFGSTATGQTHEWSDLDVMVVEESEAPFIERGLRLARRARRKLRRGRRRTDPRWPALVQRECDLRARGAACEPLAS